MDLKLMMKISQILMDCDELPSIANLSKNLNISITKTRTILKELLRYKIIFPQSSKGYSINYWIKKLLSSNIKVISNENEIIFYDNKYISLKFNKSFISDKYLQEINSTIDINISKIALYYLIFLNKKNHTINDNKIYLNENNKICFRVCGKIYKTDHVVFEMNLYPNEYIQWKS